MRNLAIALGLGMAVALGACDVQKSRAADAEPLQAKNGNDSDAPEANLNTASKSTQDALRYRRVLVPADRPEDWPRDSAEHYLSVPIRDFNERISQIDNGGGRTPNGIAPLMRATYWARVDRDELVDGRLEWEFGHRGTKQEVVVLGKCGFALSDLQWTDAAEEAVVGNDEHGRLVALVDHSGTIAGRWSMRGRQDGDGLQRFELTTPSCGLSILNLTLPDGIKPAVDHGVVTGSTDANGGGKVWRIELGGSDRTCLKIIVAPGSRSAKTIAVHENATYRLSEHGLELTADFEMLEARSESQQFVLQIDQRLTLAGVRLNGAPINAQLDSESPDDNATRRYLVELPPSLSGERASLRVIATGPWTIEKVAALPLVRLTGARWESGTARIEIDSSCELGELLTKDCRPMRPEPELEGNTEGES
ncbi:MAG TPA: hypothetical protein VGI75_01295, partial [Pirellulales bacterium]